MRGRPAQLCLAATAAAMALGTTAAAEADHFGVGDGHWGALAVPDSPDLSVPAGASVVPERWDGGTGGAVVLLATRGVHLDGEINASGAGFRGGWNAVDGPTNTYGCTLLDQPSPQGGLRGE